MTMPTPAEMDRQGTAVGCTTMALLMLAGWLLTTLLIWGYAHTVRDPNDIAEYANRQDRTIGAVTPPRSRP